MKSSFSYPSSTRKSDSVVFCKGLKAPKIDYSQSNLRSIMLISCFCILFRVLKSFYSRKTTGRNVQIRFAWFTLEYVKHALNFKMYEK